MTIELTVFNEFETGLLNLETSDAEMEFEDTPEGLSERRKWYKTLRKGTNALDKIRKEAGSEYLRLGREVNAEAKTIQTRLDVMELPHKTILDAEDAKVQKEIDELAEKNRLEAEAKEAKRIADLEEREVKAQAIIDAAEKVEREVRVAQEAADLAKQIEADKLAAVEAAKKQAAKDALDAKIKAQEEAEAAIAKVKQDADDKIMAERKAAHDKEGLRVAQELADKNEADRVADEEAARVADVEHRNRIEYELGEKLFRYVPDITVCTEIIEAMKSGEIPHTEIKY